MICRHCGSEFDGKFCPNCGSPADNYSSNANVPYGQPQQYNQPYNQQYGHPGYNQQGYNQQYGQPGYNQYNNGHPNGGTSGIPKRSIIVCIILCFVTCGIYLFIWFMSITDDTNKLYLEPNGTSGGTALLLTLVTCGIYLFYWAYKQGEKLDVVRQSRGLSSGKLSRLYLVLSLFGLVIVAGCLMQSEINTFA